MAAQVHQTNARDDLMMAALQPRNHPARVGKSARLAENFIIQKNQRVGGENERIGNLFGDHARLAMRVELADFERRKMFMGDFVSMAGQHLEFHRQQFEQFRATRRGRGQNERRQFHNPILHKSAALSSAGKMRR